MTLTAVYLPENSLPHIFGNNHEGKTLNIGGKNVYKIEAIEKTLFLSIVFENRDYIEGFYGQNITDISAIVGKNGIGKTSILRAINHSFDNKSVKALYLFNTETGKILIKNELDAFTFETKLEYENLSFSDFNSSKLYYSPVLDYELFETKTPLRLANSSNDSLYSIYLSQITKSILLLNDPVIDEIKKIYPDFPFYESVSIKLSNLKKGYFQDTYARANLGNKERVDVAKIYIESDLDKYKNDQQSTSIPNIEVISLLERYVNLIKSKSFNSLFEDIWDLEQYRRKEPNEFFQDGEHFLENFEITILSYLLLGAVFPDTPFQGSYDFSNITSADTFEERLNELLTLFIANSNKYIFDKIIEKYDKVRITDFQNLKKIIDDSTSSPYTIQGLESTNSIKLLKKHLNTFREVNGFYNYLKSLINENKFTLYNGELLFDFNKHSSSDFLEFVNKYKLLIESLDGLPINIVIFDFKPEKTLSSGEKSLLNFFTTIFDYINIINKREHQKLNYYLLLLDEPELGYHPLWKKKFIQAITKILPVLFKKSILNEEFPQDTPSIQIIFTTHDPLTLSDIPNSNIIYLEYNKENKKCEIVNSTDDYKKSFAANISDLLSDSFFLNDGLIGDFAKEKIQDTIDWILEQRIKKASITNAFYVNQEEYSYHEKIIRIIDENILRIKLAEMLEELVDENKLQTELLTREINYLNKKKDDLSRPK